MALVSRDPFAREEIHREVEPSPKYMVLPPVSCDWCGGTNGKGKVYSYRIETDGGRTFPLKGRFCSQSCFRIYHS